MNSPRVAQEATVMSDVTAVKAPTATPAPPALALPDGRRVRIIHLVAELAPFARSGGLGEAVASLARFQAASGIPTAIMMPLYEAVRQTAPAIEPVGPPFRVQLANRVEPVRLWRLA